MNHRECQTCLQKAVLIVGEYLIKKTCEKVVFYNAFKCYSDGHRRTGLEILGGQTGICPTRAKGAGTSRGVRGHAPQENFKK